MGAWIEIAPANLVISISIVAPFMGAWIEIPDAGTYPLIIYQVAPFMGAWIEIGKHFRNQWKRFSRSLHGSVD